MRQTVCVALAWLSLVIVARAEEKSRQRVYENRLTPLTDPKPLLADHPKYFEPIQEERRFEAPVLVDDQDAVPVRLGQG